MWIEWRAPSLLVCMQGLRRVGCDRRSPYIRSPAISTRTISWLIVHPRLNTISTNPVLTRTSNRLLYGPENQGTLDAVVLCSVQLPGDTSSNSYLQSSHRIAVCNCKVIHPNLFLTVTRGGSYSPKSPQMFSVYKCKKGYVYILLDKYYPKL